MRPAHGYHKGAAQQSPGSTLRHLFLFNILFPPLAITMGSFDRRHRGCESSPAPLVPPASTVAACTPRACSDPAGSGGERMQCRPKERTLPLARLDGAGNPRITQWVGAEYSSIAVKTQLGKRLGQVEKTGLRKERFSPIGGFPIQQHRL